MAVRAITIEDMRLIAVSRGGRCVSESYDGAHHPLRWQCEKGHVWAAAPTCIKRGSWCPRCAGSSRRNSIEMMHQEAAKRGGRCLSSEYLGNKKNLTWECAKGHVWQARPNTLMANSTWCPNCAGNRILSLDDACAEAARLGGECLSERYVNGHTKLRWRCAKGHLWEAGLHTVRQGHWCKRCAVERTTALLRDTIDHMRELAFKRQGRCISEAYLNRESPLRWACSLGHEWEATPGVIKSGSWCPTCREDERRANRATRATKSLSVLQELAKLHGGRCLSLGPSSSICKMECKAGHVWRVDVAAIRHPKWCLDCAGGERKFRLDHHALQELARRKGGECISERFEGAHKNYRWRCRKGHEWEASYSRVNYSSWCPACAGTKKHSLEDARALAKSRGGECLSESYRHNKIKMEWRCAKGHVWRAHFNSVALGRWCPYCVHRTPLTIEEMRAIAKGRGGEVLSDRYVNSSTKLRWRCREGHEWDATPDKVKQGQWCPVCAGRLPLTIEDMRKLAASRGGLCLSIVYVNTSMPLLWECAEGHRFEATPHMLKYTGRWCQECKRGRALVRGHRVKNAA